MLSPGLLKTPEDFRAALDEALGKTKAHAQELEKAAAIGTDVHASIEKGLREDLGMPPAKIEKSTLSDESKIVAARAFGSYSDWKIKSDFKPRLIETTVYSLEYEFAGTLDVLGDHLVEGSDQRFVSVGDWKTSRYIYLSACMQIAAYRVAALEMGLHTEGPLNGIILRLPKLANDPAFEVRFIPEAELVELYFPAFLACMELWKSEQAYKKRYPWKGNKKDKKKDKS